MIGAENSLLAPPLERLLAGGELAETALLFNPLVLVGPAGSGKSHIAQGLVRRFHGHLAEDQIGYFTAADYGRELQAAQTDEQLAPWRARVRRLRLLVVEDIEHLRPRTTIQYDLRETIDRVVRVGGAVIITADREPAAIENLDRGLRDRLLAGLTVRVQRPGLAARREIIRQTAATRGVTISDEDVSKLAQREASTAAELLGRVSQYTSGSLPCISDPPPPCGEGVLRRVPASPPSLALPTRGRGPERGGRKPDVPNLHAQLKQIIAVTARYFGVTQAALTGPSRRTSLVAARNAAVYLARRLTGASYAQIGRSLGGRDHTTIMHAQRRLAEELTADPTTQQAVDELDRLLR